MSTFSEALDHLKKGGKAKRELVKNNSFIQEYKKRLYHNVEDVRASYVPTNSDLMTDDWLLF